MCKVKIYEKEGRGIATLQPVETGMLNELGRFVQNEKTVGSLIISSANFNKGGSWTKEVMADFFGDESGKDPEKPRYAYDGHVPTMKKALRSVANVATYPRRVSILSLIPDSDGVLPSGLHLVDDLNVVALRADRGQVFVTYYNDDGKNLEMLLAMVVAFSKIAPQDRSLEKSTKQIIDGMVRDYPELKEVPSRVTTILANSASSIIKNWRNQTRRKPLFT